MICYKYGQLAHFMISNTLEIIMITLSKTHHLVILKIELHINNTHLQSVIYQQIQLQYIFKLSITVQSHYVCFHFECVVESNLVKYKC